MPRCTPVRTPHLVRTAACARTSRWLAIALRLQWIVTTPMLLIDLGMLCRMSLSEAAFIAVADVLMIASGYV